MKIIGFVVNEKILYTFLALGLILTSIYFYTNTATENEIKITENELTVTEHKDALQTDPEIKITSFRADKEVYESYENMSIFIIIETESPAEDILVRVYGIKPYNYAYINETKTTGLLEGSNEITFLFKTPHCTSGCGGVYPGSYDIYAELHRKGEIISSSVISIKLKGD